jgi:hypothetical protein
MSSQHPGENILALHASGDLDLRDRLRVALHVRGCGACSRQVANYQSLRADLASIQATSDERLSDWDRLSEEMTANIRLGISAAECVGPARKGRSYFAGFFWNPAVMAAGAFVLLTGAFLLNMPLDRIGRLWHLKDQSGLVLESTSSGIEMRRDGLAVISVHHPDRKSHDVAANLDGSMSAGYVDDETGQYTIINVAGQ